MKLSEYKKLREYNRELMGEMMLAYEKELRESPRPKILEDKQDYIRAWLAFFDEDTADDELNFKYRSEPFLGLSKFKIRQSFEWAVEHFAELDLGGNMKWLGAAMSVAGCLENNTWKAKDQRELVLHFMQDTRWFEPI